MQHSQHPPLPAQLQNESAIQYHMFQQWTYLGPVRTVREMAEHFQCSRKHIYALIKKFQWQERAATYDIEVAQIRHEEILKRNHNFKEQERILVESLYTNLLILGTKLRIDVITLSEVPSEEKAHKAKEDDIRISRQMLTLYRYTRLLEKYRRLLGIKEPSLLETLPSTDEYCPSRGVDILSGISRQVNHIESSRCNVKRGRSAEAETPTPGLTDDDLAEIDQIAEDIHTHFQTKTDSYLLTDDLKELVRQHNKATKTHATIQSKIVPLEGSISSQGYRDKLSKASPRAFYKVREVYQRKALPPAHLTASS